MNNIKFLCAGLLAVTIIINACTNNKLAPSAAIAKTVISYTCPMHPQVMEEHQGSCPICGMTLVKRTGQVSAGAKISLNTVLLPINSNVISLVGSVTPVEKVVPVKILADGYLDFDTRTFNNITSRFSGRIEKLYIKYAFQEIHAGQRIFDIYSPDLVTAQQDLIYLTKNSAQETELINSAKQKLLLLGITMPQINQIIKTNKAFYSIPVYSAYEGHVHDVAHNQMAVATETKTDFTNNLPLNIREGMYVTRGQTLFNVVNPHRLWAIIKVSQSQAGPLKLNQAVKLTLPDMPGMLIEGKVNFIEPALQNGDKTTSIRVYIDNMDHKLKVNALVKATIQSGTIKALWIPRSALLDLGSIKVVWLKQGASFKTHEVSIGIRGVNQIQVTKGLTVTDSLAVNAQYLTDSESFIKTQGDDE